MKIKHKKENIFQANTHKKKRKQQIFYFSVS